VVRPPHRKPAAHSPVMGINNIRAEESEKEDSIHQHTAADRHHISPARRFEEQRLYLVFLYSFIHHAFEIMQEGAFCTEKDTAAFCGFFTAEMKIDFLLLMALGEYIL